VRGGIFERKQLKKQNKYNYRFALPPLPTTAYHLKPNTYHFPYSFTTFRIALCPLGVVSVAK
jgi:hypothetical protein